MIRESDPRRWAELCAEFDDLVELEPGARAERLAAIGASDPAAQRMLEQLLDADASPSSPLGRLDAIFGVTGPPAFPALDEDPDVLRLVGQTIGHFQIVEPLATGGMGVVYRALDTHIGRPVALKFLRPEGHLDGPARERFLREARAAGALDHPNICSIHQAGELADGRLFLAMPLYEGETLKARLGRTGPLPVAEAIALAEQLARGLQAAHRAGIVHRDLKPANAMVLPDGGLRMLDFGIARVGEPPLGARPDRLGTVAYMAPEQLRGEASDARTDLWSLGVVLYEMLTGRRPFEGQHDLAIAHAILHSTPTPPSALRSDLPGTLDSLVMRLLAREPAERPTAAEGVATELAALGSELAARSRTKSPPRTRRVLAWSLVVVLGVSLGAVAWQLLGAGGTPAAPRIVAVLPFEDLTDRADAAHLSVAIPDEIATALSRLRALAVLERGTVLAVRDPDREMADVALALGADAVVRGRVVLAGTELRLVVDVFAPGRRQDIWTREFRGADTTAQALQRQATDAIIATLGVARTREERAGWGQVSLTSAAAWDLYLRGRAAEFDARLEPFVPPNLDALQEAQSYYARAREDAPGFASAHARLATILLALPASEQTAARRDQARLEAETALRLEPGLPAAHEALASYWVFRDDQHQAVAELERALAGRPNAPELYTRLGEVLPRVGRWDEAAAAFAQATRLDPRSRQAHLRAALIHGRLRRYDEAIAHWDQVIALGPAEEAFPQIIRGYAYLRLGNADSFDIALRRIPLGRDPGGMTTYAHWTAHRVRGRHAEAVAVLDSARGLLSADDFIYMPLPLMRAQSLETMGDSASARLQYARATSLLTDSVAAHPREARIRIALALALAGSGRIVDARREALEATALLPALTSNSIAATAFRGALIEVYARIGDRDAALELIELLLAMPAGREVTVPLLQLDPNFAPLREDPRWTDLMERFSPPGPPR